MSFHNIIFGVNWMGNNFFLLHVKISIYRMFLVSELKFAVCLYKYIIVMIYVFKVPEQALHSLFKHLYSHSPATYSTEVFQHRPKHIFYVRMGYTAFLNSSVKRIHAENPMISILKGVRDRYCSCKICIVNLGSILI